MSDPAPASAGRVFISYRRDDTAYPAGWLYDRLVEHLDGEVFKDIDSIELGEDWVEAITRAVASCDVMLALIGEEWLTTTDENGRRRLDDPTDFVRLEIETALNRDVRVIPILVDGAQMPPAAGLPPGLAGLVRRQAMELSPSRFDADTGRLLEVLDAELVELRSAEEHRLAAGTPPPGPPHGRSSYRRLVLAGLGASALVVAVVAAIALLGSGETPGSAGPGAVEPRSSTAGAGGETTPTGPGSEADVMVASFEAGEEGWRPDADHPGIGTVEQVTDFHTHGSSGLRVDSVGRRGQGWYGTNDLRLDITGRTTLLFDVMTRETGTETAVAVQYADDEWCQLRQPWEWVPARTDLRTVTVDLDTLTDCPGAQPSATSRATLAAVWVWFGGDGSFRLDNVRVR